MENVIEAANNLPNNRFESDASPFRYAPGRGAAQAER